jgi:hypothetical protein
MPIIPRLILAAALLAVAFVSLAKGKGQPAKRCWDELAREVQCYWTVRIALADNTVVEGRSAEFTTAGLKMLVEKTSRKRLHPKGPILIPREQVTTLDIRTNRPFGRAVDRHFQHVEVRR